MPSHPARYAPIKQLLGTTGAQNLFGFPIAAPPSARSADQSSGFPKPWEEEPMDTRTKREREKQLVSQMIALYCKRRHHTRGALCPTCAALRTYAEQRSEKCPFMETKTFCSNCQVHCYKPEMRAQIREVMRFSGPRMMFHHPVMAIRHVIESKKEKRKMEETS
jgi:hypothetical protein